MLTTQLKNVINSLWEKFWTGGITNPLTVIEQISYLMFARLLDMQEELNERKAMKSGKEFKRMFPESKEGQELRWKNFKNKPGKELLRHLKDNVYPYFTKIHMGDSDIGDFMADADMEIKNESVLVSAIQMIDKLPLGNSDIKGDLYEFLLSKLTTAGINGQFRTPRHIIDMMVEMIDPQPTEVIGDPACGTAGFLVRTMEYLNRQYSSPEGIFEDEDGNKHYTGDLLEPYREHINKDMFWGFDFDNTMLRMSAMNMLLHGVPSANIHYQDSLNKSIKENFRKQEKNFFDVVLANPPFKGSLDEANVNPDTLRMVKTKKTELLFVAHILRSLNLGGRCAMIVPDGVMFGSSKAHQELRRLLIEENQLDGIVSLPSGVFKPYAGVSTAVMIFTKGGETDQVWFYDVKNDGLSLDDKREEVKGNNIPEVINRWKEYKSLRENNKSTEIFSDRKQPCFYVPADEIKKNKYDLSINRYKEVKYEEVKYDQPLIILKKLEAIEKDIQNDLNKIKELIS